MFTLYILNKSLYYTTFHKHISRTTGVPEEYVSVLRNRYFFTHKSPQHIAQWALLKSTLPKAKRRHTKQFYIDFAKYIVNIPLPTLAEVLINKPWLTPEEYEKKKLQEKKGTYL